MYTACKTGNLVELKRLIESYPEIALQITAQSENSNAELNLAYILCHQFGDKRLTLLHVASSGGHKECIQALLDAGCDPSISDKQGVVPYLSTSSKDVRNVFRHYRRNHPVDYDYALAKVPEPLDEAQEEAKRAKEAEKRKQAKKARKEKIKDKKEEERKVRHGNSPRIHGIPRNSSRFCANLNSYSDRSLSQLSAEL